MEGFDVFDVPEDGFLLAADFRRRIWTACKLHVMEGEEVDVFHKLGFPSYQVLDQLAGSTINLVMLSVIVFNKFLSERRGGSLTITSSCIPLQTPPQYLSLRAQLSQQRSGGKKQEKNQFKLGLSAIGGLCFRNVL